MVVDARMAGESIHAAGNTPDVEVVYVFHALDLFHIIDKIRERDVPGRGFQENIGSLAENAPGSKRDKHGYADRQQGVNQRPTGQKEDDASQHYADRQAHVAKDL